jgi:CheY-like chemotaxis protein
VGVAGRGSEGVEKAIRERPEVALVDIGLPDMDGHEVARRIRGGIDGPIYLIALTGYAGSKARASALEAGFDAHVAKPVSPERLEVLLQNSVPSA